MPRPGRSILARTPTISAWTAPPIKFWSDMAMAGLAVIDARDSPADRGHSTARPSGRFSTQFRKQSGVRQSPQGTHDRSPWIADPGSRRRTGPSRSPATISRWRSVETPGKSSTVFRNPAKLAVFSIEDGELLASLDICGDADDLFVDPKRHRVYVSCGEGFLDVLDAEGSGYKHIAHIPTVSGARTSLFVPELDRLLLAVRAEAGQPASIWVFHPTP